MPTDSKADLATYLAANKTPDPAVVAAWEKAIALEAAAAESLTPPAVNSGPGRDTRSFLDDMNADEWKLRNKADADEILEQPKFDSEVHAERRQKVFGRFQIGSTRGATNVNGDTP